MEEYIKELEAKSVEITMCGKKHRLFFGSTTLAEAPSYGLTIDANALFGGHIDPMRSIKEVQKVLYLCALKYRDVAAKLGVKLPSDIPTLAQIEIWAEFEPIEAEKGIRYVFEQLTTRVEMIASQKKSPNVSSIESERSS